MKLWLCFVPGFSAEQFEALTRSKARYRCLLALWGAGYKSYSFKHITVRRHVEPPMELFS